MAWKVGSFVLLLLAGSATAQTYDAGDGPSFQFEQGQLHDLGSWSVSVAIGDINGDGRLDVVAATAANTLPLANDDRLFVFLQNAAGLLDSPLSQPHLQFGPHNSLAVADLDGKHGADIVLGGPLGVTTFLADGTGAISPGTVATAGSSMTALPMKLSDSGVDDLVAVGWSSSGFRYINDGSGSFSTQPFDVVVYGANTMSRIRLDGDDREDLIVASGQGTLPNLHLFRNDGKGGLVPSVSLSASCDLWGARSVSAGDLNGDGLDDIVVSSGWGLESACLLIMYASADGQFSRPVVVPVIQYPSALKVVDINLDGRKDIVVMHPHWFSMGVHTQREDGTLNAAVYTPMPEVVFPAGNNLAVGDLTGDGCPDVAVANGRNELVIVRAKFCRRVFTGTFEDSRGSGR